MEKVFLITAITRVVMIDEEEYPESRTVFSANIPANEIIFFYSGENTVFFGDERLEDRKGTIRFLPKGNFSRYEVERREPGECILICFDADRPLSDKALSIKPMKAERLGHLFKKLFVKWTEKGEGYYFECLALLYKIFAELWQDRNQPPSHYQKIAPACEHINSFFLKEKMTTAALSSMCGISESYFKRLFKEKYGMPPNKYLIHLKINHACDLLRLERYSVSKTAELSGFSDVYFFSRQFKEYMGITPTQFIEKYRSSK